ncbi:MAG: DUF1848 domain-containing protein [Bacillota bacterium]|nr:DUF1848 domain-containing protein [Bacillota bacterium]
MIISASRRTDIPAFYGEWFMNRVREGYCLVPNPFNPRQVARVSLKPGDVEAIVFWSKDPVPFFPHLDELDRRGYRYYFLVLDWYRKTERRLAGLAADGYRFEKVSPGDPQVKALLRRLREIAAGYGMEMRTCAEGADLRDVGTMPGSCVDGDLLRRLWGVEAPGKDPNQRAACGCAVSKDIGVNDTCMHGCRYCYATRGEAYARSRWQRHDPQEPVLLRTFSASGSEG